jgi:hypothetical protein
MRMTVVGLSRRYELWSGRQRVYGANNAGALPFFERRSYRRIGFHMAHWLFGTCGQPISVVAKVALAALERGWFAGV